MGNNIFGQDMNNRSIFIKKDIKNIKDQNNIKIQNSEKKEENILNNLKEMINYEFNENGILINKINGKKCGLLEKRNMNL